MVALVAKAVTQSGRVGVALVDAEPRTVARNIVALRYSWLFPDVGLATKQVIGFYSQSNKVLDRRAWQLIPAAILGKGCLSCSVPLGIPHTLSFLILLQSLLPYMVPRTEHCPLVCRQCFVVWGVRLELFTSKSCLTWRKSDTSMSLTDTFSPV